MRTRVALVVLPLLFPFVFGCVGYLEEGPAVRSPPATPPGEVPTDRGTGTGGAGVEPGAGGAGKVTPIVPPPATLRLLTARQYRNAIRDVFGDDISTNVELQRDVSIKGFVSIGAAATGLTGKVLFGDYCLGYVRAAEADDQGRLTSDEHVGHLDTPSAWRQGPDGYIYVSTFGACQTDRQNATDSQSVFYRVE